MVLEEISEWREGPTPPPVPHHTPYRILAGVEIRNWASFWGDDPVNFNRTVRKSAA
jgi:hypothetical protein